MDPIDYDAEYARLLREIDTLPADQQEALRAMHAESVQRHAEIQENRAKTDEALGELQDQLKSMGEGFQQLDTALADLRLVAKMAVFELEARRRERRAEADGSDDAPEHD